jgi:multicomponent Na+:H+ antiporter subunit E
VVKRWLAVFCWAELTWTLLTWTATAEQIGVGVAVSAAAAFACAPLGDVAGPWVLLDPRRAWALLRLGAVSAVRVVRANLSLTRRIWSRTVPLPSGMVITPTRARTDGELTAVGLITSLIVDSQLVDLDRYRHELQYHVVAVGGDPPNAAVEELVVR